MYIADYVWHNISDDGFQLVSSKGTQTVDPLRLVWCENLKRMKYLKVWEVLNVKSDRTRKIRIIILSLLYYFTVYSWIGLVSTLFLSLWANTFHSPSCVSSLTCRCYLPASSCYLTPQAFPCQNTTLLSKPQFCYPSPHTLTTFMIIFPALHLPHQAGKRVNKSTTGDRLRV